MRVRHKSKSLGSQPPPETNIMGISRVWARFLLLCYLFFTFLRYRFFTFVSPFYVLGEGHGFDFPLIRPQWRMCHVSSLRQQSRCVRISEPLRHVCTTPTGSAPQRPATTLLNLGALRLGQHACGTPMESAGQVGTLSTCVQQSAAFQQLAFTRATAVGDDEAIRSFGTRHPCFVAQLFRIATQPKSHSAAAGLGSQHGLGDG